MHSVRFAAAVLALPLQGQEPVHENRLAHETSPYLLQHKNNPVDWYPWGDEAWQRARDEDKVVFLSIGYSACHWCHVMEHESFEDPKIAALLNDKFVNIKVDREERPDLDDIYMTAVTAMTGNGGWPMTVFLSPTGKPFFGGTYFPPEDRHGMPGFRRVIEHVDNLWNTRREEVDKASADLARHLREQLRPEPNPGDPELAFLATAAANSLARYDAEHGGFAYPPRHAPKFPHGSELRVLLRSHARSGEREPLAAAEHTLRRMREGGMYDQLAGGFHRYSTDREWLVPHFEKMLYDNALLVPAYAEAFRLTGDSFYADVVRDVLDYLLREMQDDAGGFYSTTDADSEGVEGKFFVWQKDEIEQLLGEDAALACAYWGVSEAGNWEHTNVLHIAQPLAAAAQAVGLEVDDAAARIERARATLLAARASRVPPGTDDKVLAAWNGMAIAACAIGHQVTGDERYLAAGRRAAEFVLREMRVEGRLRRVWRRGEARLTAYLEDYAFLADGLLSLFESDFDPRWLREAQALLAVMREHYLDDEHGGFFFTADDHEELVVRTKSVAESSIPSGQAMAALALLRAGLLLGDEELEDLGVGVLRAAHPVLTRQPLSAPTLLLAVDLHLSDPREVVIAGEPGAADSTALLQAVRAAYPPHHVVALVHDDNREELEALSPLFAGKTASEGALAFVCRRGVCEAPVSDKAQLSLGGARAQR